MTLTTMTLTTMTLTTTTLTTTTRRGLAFFAEHVEGTGPR